MSRGRGGAGGASDDAGARKKGGRKRAAPRTDVREQRRVHLLPLHLARAAGRRHAAQDVEEPRGRPFNVVGHLVRLGGPTALQLGPSLSFLQRRQGQGERRAPAQSAIARGWKAGWCLETGRDGRSTGKGREHKATHDGKAIRQFFWQSDRLMAEPVPIYKQVVPGQEGDDWE